MADDTTCGLLTQAIPHELRSIQRWIRWRYDTGETRDDRRKRPCSWDGDYWTSYHNARHWRDLREEPPQGVALGFSFSLPVDVDVDVDMESPGAPLHLIALDLDACRHPVTGAVEPWARDLVGNRCRRTYTEITPSGTGLRAWLLVRRLPRLKRAHFLPQNPTRPEGVDKAVDCQVFGGGLPGFVTVTGNKVAGAHDHVEVLDNLDWWSEVFGVPVDTGEGATQPLAELPKGLDPAMTIAKVIETVRADAEGRALMDHTFNGRYKSDSEAFAALTNVVAKAAGYDGALTRDVLLMHLPRWQAAGVDPKYSRAEWVTADLLRTMPSRPPFEPIPGDAGEMGAAGARRRPWQRRTLAALLAEKSPPWSVQGYARLKQVGVLAAFPGVGKSTLAAAWMMSAVYGRTWCGRKVRPGSVVALVGENRRGFANTLDAYARHHKFGSMPPGRYLEIVDYRLPLSGADGQGFLRALLADVVAEHGEPPVMLVIDTLSSHWAESEDSSEYMAPAMRALAALAEQWSMMVLVLHHTTKLRGATVLPEIGDVRGSSVVGANTDFTLGMCQPAVGEAQLAALKMKNDQKPPAVRLSMVSVPCGFDEDGEAVSAGVFEDRAEPLTGQEAEASKQLEADLRTLLDVLARTGPCRSKGSLAEQAHINRGRAFRVIDVGLDRGVIENTGTTKEPCYRATNKGRTAMLSILTDTEDE